MQFEFSTAGRILFGSGAIKQAGSIIGRFGRRAFVVTGKDTRRTAPLTDRLKREHIDYVLYGIAGEPTVDMIDEGVRAARNNQIDVVIGYGGGSSIDSAKAIAAMAANPGQLLDYLEVVGLGRPIGKTPLPAVAIPTTAGTGAEVTRNAVIAVESKRVKVSLRSLLILPQVAIVDPDLTLSLPPAITACTGLDALTQLIEAFTSCKANPLTDGICREGLRRAAGSLLAAYEHGDDRKARTDMSLASLLGGLALANAGLGAVHGFAGVLGGLSGAPHGVICGRLVALVTQANINVVHQSGDSVVLAKYYELAQILTGDQHAQAEQVVTWLNDLCTKLSLPPLSKFGLHQDQFGEVAGHAQRSSSMKGNPVQLAESELIDILNSERLV